MKNYDALMEKMSPEMMAELNVRLVTVEGRRLFYMTSPGQLFPIDKYEDAVRFEYRWLNLDPEHPDTEPSDNVSEPKDEAADVNKD